MAEWKGSFLLRDTLGISILADFDQNVFCSGYVLCFSWACSHLPNLKFTRDKVMRPSWECAADLLLVVDSQPSHQALTYFPVTLTSSFVPEKCALSPP
jgi:hypothetical protein